MIGKAIEGSGPGFLELRRIEAAKDIAETLARSRNVIYLPGGSGGAGGASNILLVREGVVRRTDVKV